MCGNDTVKTSKKLTNSYYAHVHTRADSISSNSGRKARKTWVKISAMKRGDGKKWAGIMRKLSESYAKTASAINNLKWGTKSVNVNRDSIQTLYIYIWMRCGHITLGYFLFSCGIWSGIAFPHNWISFSCKISFQDVNVLNGPKNVLYFVWAVNLALFGGGVCVCMCVEPYTHTTYRVNGKSVRMAFEKLNSP